MTSPQEPYRPPQVDEGKLEKTVPMWRLVVATMLRVLGLAMIAIAVLAIAKELFRSRFMDPSLDLAGIAIAIVTYVGIGGLLIVWGAKIAKGGNPRKQDESTRNV